MICTSSVGAISMYFALAEMLGHGNVGLVPLAMLWGAFVLWIDCWLVSSSVGGRLRARLAAMLPRLVIAIFLGVLIAVPLELRVFQTAVMAEVQAQRQQQVQTLTSELKACNPVPGAPAAGSHLNCAGQVLNLSPTSATIQQQLSQERTQATNLQTEITTETSQLLALQNTMNAECNGGSGTGLSGVFGDGPSCGADQQAVADFEKSHPIAQQQNQLDGLNTTIAQLEETVTAEQNADGRAVSSAIAERVHQASAAEGLLPSDPIGLGERLKAMSALIAGTPFIGAASWFIRIFFVLIDSLPVLVKLLGGRTTYDRLAEIENKHAVRIGSAAAEAEFMARSHEVTRAAFQRIALKTARSDSYIKHVRAELEDRRKHAAKNRKMSLDLETELHQNKLDRRRRASRRMHVVPPHNDVRRDAS
jgi:hypothetical protein